MNTRKRQLCAVVALLIVLVSISSPAAAQSVPDNHVNRAGKHLTPVILFPGWFVMRLQVSVRNQTIAPDCPPSGTFENAVLTANPSAEFSQVCQDKLMTLAYDPDPRKPMPRRFANQIGVQVVVADYGKTESAPLYESLYAFLEQAGYTRNLNIRVAGYDSRLTPDLGGFLPRTIRLIEETYRANGNTPVHLVGHSNGPLYAQYLLTHTSRQWRSKYIQGFTPLAGNFPGSGATYLQLFTGFNVNDVSLPADPINAASSARMYLSFPASYMSAPDPRVFGDREVVIRSVQSGKDYTPRDYQQLFRDAGVPEAAEIARYYIGFVKFAPPFYPYVDVYAEKGSGFPTTVGAQLPDLTVGQLLSDSTVYFTRNGDVNQEDITNEAVKVWQSMPCYHFELNDNPGVNHYSLPDDAAVHARLLAHLQQRKSACR
jgi:lecithin-cholesterol acyltransferase